MLYLFEDNEAVIKTIIKGRSPTVRHFWRTHRVALDWLFDRINLGPLKFKSVTLTPNTNSLTIWPKVIPLVMRNNLLRVLDLSHFRSIWCTKNFILVSCSTMAKRIHKIEKKKKGLCPSRDQQRRIYHLILLRQVPPPHQVRLHLKVRGCRQLRRNPIAGWVLNQAHSTQRRRLKCDSRMHTLAVWWKSNGETRRIKKKKIQKTPNNPAAGKWYYKGGTCCPITTKLGWNPLHKASSSVDQESQKNTEATWDHYLHMSPDTSHHMEAVFSMVWKIYAKTSRGSLWKIWIWILPVWGMFMNTTLRAAVHLGNDHDVNLRNVKDCSWIIYRTTFQRKQKSWSVASQKPLA